MKAPNWTLRLLSIVACSACALGVSAYDTYAADALTSSSVQKDAGLQVNGHGVRRVAAAGTPLYAATLYLGQPTADPQEIMANRGTKHFRIVLLQDVKASQLTQLVGQGLAANASNDDLSTLVSEIFEVGMMLSDQGTLAAGDSIEVVSSPVNGTTVRLHTAKPDELSFANPQFFKAMMAIWLGDQPADIGLKRALLGRTG
mgnify:CR=1 FL=1